MTDRCALCPGVNACIGPDGPDDADILFIGEAPGKQENHAKPPRVFIGKTGDEVNRHYLPLAGLKRANVCFTNAIRCLPTSSGGKLDGGRAKDVALLQSCAEKHLYRRIEQGHYRCIVPLGGFACRAVCPGVELELQHGIPVETGWGIPAFPMYHPALGIHEPKKMLHIRTDWQRLRQYLNGTLKVVTDGYKTDYKEVTDEEEIEALDPWAPLAGDTESTGRGEPFCITYSQKAGTGRLVRADRPDLLGALSRTLSRWRSPIIFHNWLYDWKVLNLMGLSFPHNRIVDTMARVFHLGNLPQGLKALAYRELGMTMQDFDDLVTPYSKARVMDYLEEAYTGTDWPKPESELTQDSKTGLWKIYQPQGMNTKLKRFFTDVRKNPDKDVFGAWDNWEPAHAMIEEKVGEWPGKCITHVPFEKVLYYACRDVDALIRLWPLLEHMRHRVRKVSQEHWRN